VALTFNPTLKCPSQSADFCEGWTTAARFNATEYQTERAAAKGILND
jgi:hypothetical protein